MGENTRPRRRVLFMLSGSIAAYKACDALSTIVQSDCEVQTLATAGALKFVGEATLEGLTRSPVFTDTFTRGRLMDHIELARWADVALLCPASASALGRLANGGGSDALAAVFLAYPLRDKPLWIAPAMNQAMWSHPSVQESVGKLKKWGARFLMPESGRQACGDVGEGRLVEPPQIVEAVLSSLRNSLQPGKENLR